MQFGLDVIEQEISFWVEDWKVHRIPHCLVHQNKSIVLKKQSKRKTETTFSLWYNNMMTEFGLQSTNICVLCGFPV
jgi:hypothetical protein